AAVGAHAAPERGLAAPLDADPRADAESIPWPPVEPNLEPVILIADLVEQEPDRPAVIGENDVDVAVVVDVAERGAAADLRTREGRTGLAADLFKGDGGWTQRGRSRDGGGAERGMGE